MHNSENTTQYILDLVKQDISILEAQRIDIIERFISGSSWSERDINHGQLLALAKVRGRLEAMLSLPAQEVIARSAQRTTGPKPEKRKAADLQSISGAMAMPSWNVATRAWKAK